MDLSEKAAETEAAVRTGRAVEEAIQSLSLFLAAVPEAIRAALPNETSGNGPGQLPNYPAAVVEPLTRLKELLESDDGEAADFIVDAKSRLAGVLTPVEIKMLSDRVGNFEFAEALSCLTDIASRLGLDCGLESPSE
jgi:hypothetical protein